MQLGISLPELEKVVARQLDSFFGISANEELILKDAIEEALVRTGHSFSYSNNKYYKKNDVPFFNPFHSGQYAIFLYFLSNTIFSQFPGERTLADRIYYLNKAMNSVELYYEVALPSIFFLDHPIGSVMGRAVYGDMFSFSQNCTVGNNHGIYPTIGKNVRMAAGATILGSCSVGDNVILAARSYVKDTDIPSCSVVFGSFPNLVIKPKDINYFRNAEVNYRGFNGLI